VADMIKMTSNQEVKVK